MINIDPLWKKEKLFEEIEDIEKKIETSALDHKAERKLLDRRKKLIDTNDKWLKERRESNPEMVTYINARREMNSLYRDADKSHRNMLDGVEKAQPQHEKQMKIRNELKEIRRQLDRAKELLSQSDKGINHWERRLEKGFGELDGGFSDLLEAQKKVSQGGDSSFARKKKPKIVKKRKPINNPKEEEE
jgi:chromosome segregation ATPase